MNIQANTIRMHEALAQRSRSEMTFGEELQAAQARHLEEFTSEDLADALGDVENEDWDAMLAGAKSADAAAVGAIVIRAMTQRVQRLARVSLS